MFSEAVKTYFHHQIRVIRVKTVWKSESSDVAMTINSKQSSNINFRHIRIFTEIPPLYIIDSFVIRTV